MGVNSYFYGFRRSVGIFHPGGITSPRTQIRPCNAVRFEASVLRSDPVFELGFKFLFTCGAAELGMISLQAGDAYANRTEAFCVASNKPAMSISQASNQTNLVLRTNIGTMRP